MIWVTHLFRVAYWTYWQHFGGYRYFLRSSVFKIQFFPNIGISVVIFRLKTYTVPLLLKSNVTALK